MSNQWAKVVLDSVAPNGKRLITVEARYARWIHSELMTHRAFSRNAASSRAIPFIAFAASDLPNKVGDIKPNCTFAMIRDDPFIPDFIGAEQRGMQSGDELDEFQKDYALKLIDEMRLYCLYRCQSLSAIGVHKSIINRYLEPWSYITTLITATEWKNFFRLRIHPAAEKHFNDIAVKIKAAIDASTPNKLEPGEWHLPYIQDDEYGGDGGVESLKRVSVARCARVSYLSHDNKRDVAADLKLFDRLMQPGDVAGDDEPIHASPLEHVAAALGTWQGHVRSGPFLGWHQFRKEFANENVAG